MSFTVVSTNKNGDPQSRAAIPLLFNQTIIR